MTYHEGLPLIDKIYDHQPWRVGDDLPPIKSHDPRGPVSLPDTLSMLYLQLHYTNCHQI